MKLSSTPSPRPEYPRPDFSRPDWSSLNGVWEFAFDDADAGEKEKWWDGRPLGRQIVVPFPYQSELSGIDDKSIHEVVWYARTFAVPARWRARSVLLHFGAVDYSAAVWLNGREVGRNRGGHVPFSFDITSHLREGENRLVVRVEDRQTPKQPRGKQSPSGKPARIYYYCTTGIWQTVWLESVPPLRIEAIKYETAASLDAIELTAYLHAPFAPRRLEVEVYESLEGEEIVARAEAESSSAVVRCPVKIPDARPWSPESPHLYKLRLRLFEGSELLDAVESYAGLRTVALEDKRFVLNGEPRYLAMVLDQGYWPEGLLAAPSDEALRADIEWVKRFGFNSVRKHQKIEDPRWLYWCDRLGVLVWEEMPNAMRWSLTAEENLLAEWERAVRRDCSHPSIITWIPVNETMGFRGARRHHPGQRAFFERVVRLTRRLDPSRPVIDNDGWEHTDLTDICTLHDYTPDLNKFRERYRELLGGGEPPAFAWHRKQPLFLKGARYRGQPLMLSEVGGFLLLPPGRSPAERDRLYLHYGSYGTGEDLLNKYRELMEVLSSFKFLSGFCYTQLTDIEQEANGLLTYDRGPKVDPQQVAEVHRRLFGDAL